MQLYTRISVYFSAFEILERDFTARHIIKKFIIRVLENVIKRAFGELNNVFQDEFNKNVISTVNECQIIFITHWIKQIKLKNRGPKRTHLSMFCNFCVGWRHDVNVCTVWYMMSWNLISHVLETRKFVMAILQRKQGLLCDKTWFFDNWTGSRWLKETICRAFTYRRDNLQHTMSKSSTI